MRVSGPRNVGISSDNHIVEQSILYDVLRAGHLKFLIMECGSMVPKITSRPI